MARDTEYARRAREATEVRARLVRELAALRARPGRAIAVLRRARAPFALGLAALLAAIVVVVAYRHR